MIGYLAIPVTGYVGITQRLGLLLRKEIKTCWSEPNEWTPETSSGPN